MNIIICIDDKNGYSLFGRRQSMDKLVRQRILTVVEENILYMNAYSEKQFDDGLLAVCDDFLSVVGDGEYCFIENVPFSLEKCEKIIIYKWNRSYPADMFLDYDYIRKNYHRTSLYEFSGSSHEKITEEIYVKQ